MPSSLFRDGLLDGQIAVVTGGGTGLGVAIARELAHLGATVIIASRKAEHVEPAAAGLSAETGGTVLPEILDIRDREAVAAFVDRTLARHGRVDLLVNNGGGQFFAPAETISPRGWDAVVGTNLTGTWNLIQAMANGWMLEHGGRIVNITMLTKRTFCGMAHSVSARAGVEALTRTLAIEWARHGVLVNCVAPGVIASNGLRNYPAGLQLAEQMRDLVPLKRLGDVDDVAWLVAYLATPAGRYITGQTYTVDGGKELWGDWWAIPDPDPKHPIELPVESWEHDGDAD